MPRRLTVLTIVLALAIPTVLSAAPIEAHERRPLVTVGRAAKTTVKAVGRRAKSVARRIGRAARRLVGRPA